MTSIRLGPLQILRVLLLAVTVVAFTSLSDKTLKNLPGPGDDFNIKNGALLSPILIPRVPGTPGSIKVQNHLANYIRTSLPEWELHFQNSSSKTPATGDQQIPFINIIATRDPPWARPGHVGRLAVVAHYDSKRMPEGFIGATDSAAPCAIIMHAARSIDKALTKKWAAMGAEGAADNDGLEEEKGIQIIFLDGEEAFVDWSDTDSLYGARSLAEEWENTINPAMSTFHNPLTSISLFLLLDLLGAKDPNIRSYFKTTHWAYSSMATLEQRLRDLHLFKSSPNHPSKKEAGAQKESKRAQSSKSPSKNRLNKRKEPMFLAEKDKTDQNFNTWLGSVQDDHVPFMKRGVEVLHLIPSPFPHVWHEKEDDGAHLDIDTVEDWAKLITAFMAEWMELDSHFDEPDKEKRKEKVEGSRYVERTEL
ncbi:MAG: hypothetical protein M1829_001279 [Trizodia sp. TS-e1964]|nr:MAG: hypothetical protein M1829_001279 [Trizodia sp. TS-e1964]